jgi:hypothetical protein
MRLERRKFKFQGYYNSIQGYPVPYEGVLEYVEPFEAEALEAKVCDLEAKCCALEKRAAELEKAMCECHGCHTFPTVCANMVDEFFHQLFPNEYNPHKALEGKG